MYINLNQIGAVVGSQPFGGEGLSGTGPKAGGPQYMSRFMKSERHMIAAENTSTTVAADTVHAAIAAATSPTVNHPVHDLPGPTGESNRLSLHPRGTLLCLGPTLEIAKQQAGLAHKAGCPTVVIAPGARGSSAVDGVLSIDTLRTLEDVDAVALWADDVTIRSARQALAAREGKIVPLLSGPAEMEIMCTLERHVCIDTTAAGGNASLLATSG